MVMRRTDSVKRKRKEGCSSPLLDDSPKRTKVHAQRKFAQGSNVNSPVITPVKEIESERSPINVLPEPVELLPIKRPNTEDFLTFLCFRGTPILPPSLNFFNTASIVDTNGQVHEIKSESPKNGPIDIAKCGSSTEKPFIAYGVRKRADPIVISKQMDRKRRHALAIQALRRKYQEQKMAKIRALTISKLSEKVTNKTLVRTNSVSKTETITKKTSTTNTVEKTKVVATKQIKVTTQPLKTTLRPKKMCLRSFRGRFVQRELQFRPGKKRPIIEKKGAEKKTETKKEKESNSEESEYSSDDNQPLSTAGTSNRVVTRQTAKVIKKPTHLATRSTTLGNSRVTRSGHLINKLDVRRQQIKKRILLTNTQTIIKPRSLRSTTIRKTVLSQRPNTAPLKLKQVQKKPAANKEETATTKTVKNPAKTSQQVKAAVKTDVKKLAVNVQKAVEVKKEVNKVEVQKEVIADVKKEVKSTDNKKDVNKTKDAKKDLNKSAEIKKEVKSTASDADLKKDIHVDKAKVSTETSKNVNKDVQTRRSSNKMKLKEVEESLPTEEAETVKKVIKKETNIVTKKETCKVESETKVKEESPQRTRETASISPQRSARPSRKTKEAAAIYMELLSQKLVHDSKLDDDDSDSIDSFPELPNVKRTEQRENELKAQAKKSDTGRSRSKNIEKKESIPAAIVSKKSIEKSAESDDEEKKKSSKRKSNNQETEANEVKKTKLIKNEEPKPTKKSLDNSGKKNSEEKKEDKTETKRQTRNSSHTIKTAEESEDSDESFHADIKIPRQKKVTRSTTTPKPKLDSEDEELKQLIKKVQEEETPTESDCSSSVNSKSKSIKSKTKKFSKTKSKQNTDTNFSDSDEEPLSKLTAKNTENSQKSSEVDRKSRRNLETRRSTKGNSESQVNQSTKPKRECAKRPQNYLPMFSSTDEDDDYVEEVKVEVKPLKLPAEKPVSDLLSKDIKRRFGKEKVNMSNEQIEKWLKESAMAGNEVKSENDAMLKFGECIPTETTLESNDHEHIDTAKLKSSLLSDVKSESSTQSTINKEKQKLKLDIKPQAIDRKLIFRKVKKEPAPNLNAFSPENESSVYAFGEENEETPSTPFRRPSRRPSSAATSEDESSKLEECIKVAQFRIPSVKQESEKCKEEAEEEQLPHFNMPQKPSKKTEGQSASKAQKLARSAQERNLDIPDEMKYKVPSSPSASSSSSAKLSKKQMVKQEITMPAPVQEFPAKTAPAQLVEAPVFYPTEQEFQDPIEYIERIRTKAEQFGICKIVPPNSFKPECKVSDDMRFTAYNQYVQKMLHRWGPNFKELMAIKKYLQTQNISLAHSPWIGGMEIDLPRLYQTVQTLGGLKEVIEKKKWPRVSECMKIPKSAQDRVTKLDDIYCKYLLPYDTLSPAEREKLFDEVETDWAKRESKTLIKAQRTVTSDDEEEEESESDDEAEECIVKGRNMALNAFYRIGRNTMSMYFRTTEPPAEEVEQEFWKHVSQRQSHICVHSGSIDSGSWGYGFSVSKNSPFARHAWNLKVLTNNSGSVLRSMGPIMGVTVPTLHVGMVFSACCWYRDPHSLPWVEYLHTGGNKIWYGLPDSSTDLFHTTMKKLVPNFCRNKNLWLPSDTAMVPPSLLVENNVSLCRVVQDPGQFIVVFPKAFTSSICTGYVVSESVYFATPNWLKTAGGVFDDLKKSCEPSMFSLERLILSITTDTRSNIDVLRQILPSVQGICDNEKRLRDKLKTFGGMEREKLPLPEAPNSRRRKKVQEDDGDYECEICRKNLFVSMVFDADGDVVYCLEHAIKMLEEKKITLSKCKLMFTYDYDELDGLVGRIHSTIEMKMQKKIPNKYSGMPTLLTK